MISWDSVVAIAEAGVCRENFAISQLTTRSVVNVVNKSLKHSQF